MQAAALVRPSHPDLGQKRGDPVPTVPGVGQAAAGVGPPGNTVRPAGMLRRGWREPACLPASWRVVGASAPAAGTAPMACLPRRSDCSLPAQAHP